MDRPTALMGVIDPVVVKVWLMVSRPAVTAVSTMPVMTSAIIAPDPSFLKAIFCCPHLIKSEVISVNKHYYCKDTAVYMNNKNTKRQPASAIWGW
jgi:hypothetical protein